MTPKEIIQNIDKNKFTERLHSLITIYNSIAERIDGLELNGFLLKHTIECYFVDLHRMKEFHSTKFADQH